MHWEIDTFKHFESIIFVFQILFMFNIFSKKDFLVDHLDGFIDIHNHILPNIDDGAKTTYDSLDLIKGMMEIGVSNFICTPHVMHNFYDNTPKIIQKSFRKIREEIIAINLDNVSIAYAAEYMIDDNFEKLLEEGDILPLNKNHLLIEMSYLQPSINFDSAVKKIIKKQFFPVFAHPERYLYLSQVFNAYSQLKLKNIKFQLNMLSLGGYYGKEVQKTAFKLLENHYYDFIGSDIHNLQHLQAIKNITLQKKVSINVQRLIEQTNESFQ